MQFETAIIKSAHEALSDAKIVFDVVINMQQVVIGLAVYRGNNPRNGWWDIKSSHIDGHILIDTDSKLHHLKIEEAIKLIKKMNRI